MKLWIFVIGVYALFALLLAGEYKLVQFIRERRR